MEEGEVAAPAFVAVEDFVVPALVPGLAGALQFLTHAPP